MHLARALLERILFVIPLWISLGVHEWAHAAAANGLGDDTARRMGRMSLNPLVHLDPIGTVLLPVLGIPFGWAKPVPVEPIRFRTSVPMTYGLVWVAGAGPLSNLCLALLLLVVDGALFGMGIDLTTFDPILSRVFDFALTANLAMAVFNLLPIHPLDGSRIVEGLVPLERRATWDALRWPLGIIAILVVALWIGPALLEAIHAARMALRSIA